MKLFWSFSIIGSTSFGGYMALIAMIREKFVKKDKLLEDDRMTEAIVLASLLPGPVAVNVVAYVGYIMAGVIGAILSVIAVLLPSFVLVLILSALYVRYKLEFDFDMILAGIIPIVIGIIFSVAVSMWKKSCTKISEVIIAVVSLLSLFFFTGYWSAVLVILLAGFVGLILFKQETKPGNVNEVLLKTKFVWIPLGLVVAYLVVRYILPESINSRLLTEFSTISLTLFGGGYVMVPILKSLLVDQTGWFTYKEFVFGISIGQITPGPILISTAYFGYKMNGILGSVMATLGIFIPSSVLMIMASRFYVQVRDSRWIKSALSGIKPAVTGLIFYSGLSLFLIHSEQNNPGVALLIIIVAFFSVFRFNINPAIVVIAGGLLGYFVNLF